MQPIFDSLAHPTLSGDWLGRGVAAGFGTLVADLRRAGMPRACAVGLQGVEGYEHAAFAAACRPHPELVPIAGVDPVADAGVGRMRALRDLGFRGIKLHPRFSRFTQDMQCLGDLFAAAGEAGLVVFLCTYLHCAAEQAPRQDPYYDIVAALARAPHTRVVLVHGGDVQLLRYAELVRHNDNLLLDLSMTMMKYAGSSLDMDLRFLLASFDRRVCVGTDWPEYGTQEVARRFEALSAGLTDAKRDNAAQANLARFLGVAGT
jgi:predicted TIM-barrel fold metal-dependent hydrolase